MFACKVILIVLAVIAVLYLLMLRGRTGRPGLAAFQGQVFAHRGYHGGPDAPENSLEAFRRAAARGFGSELDVHLLRDGHLAVLHDSALQRMTGADGDVEDLEAAQLPSYALAHSAETIPTLEQVLAVYGGRGPLIIELKTRGRNAAALCTEVCRVLDGYGGAFCLESFDPRCLLWLRRHRPELIRGQLSDDFLKNRCGLDWLGAFLETYLLANCVTRPDFIAYRYQDRHNLSNRLCRGLWHMAGASWTIHSAEELHTAQAEGLWPIFENFDPAQSSSAAGLAGAAEA